MGFFARIDQMSFQAKAVGTILCLMIGLITSAPVIDGLNKGSHPKPKVGYGTGYGGGYGTGYGGGSGSGMAGGALRKEPALTLPATQVSLSNYFYDLSLTPHGTLKAMEVTDADTVQIKSSSDGGDTWKLSGKEINLVNEDTAQDDRLWRRLQFTDELNGWGYGNDDAGLWHTKDGGKTWLEVDLPEKLSSLEMAWVSPKVGYAAGNSFDEDGWRAVTLLKTSDGGYSWRVVSQSSANRGAVWQLLAPTENELLLSVDSSTLFHSSDGGVTWNEVLNQPNALKTVICDAAGTGWMVGAKGNLRRFTAYGKRLEAQHEMPLELQATDWLSIGLDSRTGFGVLVGTNGTLAVTYNSGKTWQAARASSVVTETPNNKKAVPMSLNFDRVIVRGNRAYLFAAGKVFRV